MTRTPSSRFASVAFVAMLVLTHVGSAVHFAVAHHAMGEHGGLVHVTAASSQSAESDSVSSAQVVTSIAEDCQVAAFQRQGVTAKAVVAEIVAPRVAASSVATPILDVRANRHLLRLAPKSSPPV